MSMDFHEFKKIITLSDQNKFFSWWISDFKLLLVQTEINNIDVIDTEHLNKVVHQLKTKKEISTIGISSNLIALGMNDGEITIYSFSEKKTVITIKQHEAKITHLVFSSNGSNLVARSEDNKIGFHSLQFGKSIVHQINSYVSCLGFTTDDIVLLTHSTFETRTMEGRRIDKFDYELGQITNCVSIPHAIIYTTPESFNILPISQGQFIHSIIPLSYPINEVTQLYKSFYGRLIITIGEKGYSIWDVTNLISPKIMMQVPMENSTTKVIWSKKEVISYFLNGDVSIWTNFNFEDLSKMVWTMDDKLQYLQQCYNALPPYVKEANIYAMNKENVKEYLNELDKIEIWYFARSKIREPFWFQYYSPDKTKMIKELENNIRINLEMLRSFSKNLISEL